MDIPHNTGGTLSQVKRRNKKWKECTFYEISSIILWRGKIFFAGNIADLPPSHTPLCSQTSLSPYQRLPCKLFSRIIHFCVLPYYLNSISWPSPCKNQIVQLYLVQLFITCVCIHLTITSYWFMNKVDASTIALSKMHQNAGPIITVYIHAKA